MKFVINRGATYKPLAFNTTRHGDWFVSEDTKYLALILKSGNVVLFNTSFGASVPDLVTLSTAEGLFASCEVTLEVT